MKRWPCWNPRWATWPPPTPPAEIQARSLQVLERADALATAARAQVLGAFTARQGYCEDADYSPRMWLINQTRVTRGTAAGHVGWARRAAAHPRLAAALAAGEISVSFARVICDWTDKLPIDSRDEADRILIDAARSGLDLRDLTALAVQMYEQSRPATPENDHPTARVRAQWAGARAAASVAGGDGAAWLAGDAAEAFACDASFTPVVMADVNPAALDDLAKLCVELAGHGPGRCGQPASPGEDEITPTERGREALEKAIVGKTISFLLRSARPLDLLRSYGCNRIVIRGVGSTP